MGQTPFDVGAPSGDDRGMDGMNQDDQNQMSSQGQFMLLH